MNLPFWLGIALVLASVLSALGAAALFPRARAPTLLLAVAVLIAHAGLYWRFTVDDAFITYRFARGWAEGLGPVYQAGGPVEGYTSFAWVALLAAATRLGFDTDLAAKLLGLLCAALTLPPAYWMVERLTSSSRAALVAPFAIALSPLFAAWACAGMDAPLFACVLTWAAWALVDERKIFKVVPLDAVLFGLSVWVRPEGALFAFVAFVCRLAGPGEWRGRAAGALRWGLVAAAVAAPFWVWRWTYYGRFFPNTLYAKLNPSLAVRVETGARSLLDFATDAGIGWIALAVLGVAGMFGRGPGGRFPPLAVAMFLAYVFWAGGDVLHLRFYAHVLPLLAVCLGVGVAGLAAADRAPRGRRVALAGALGLIWAALAFQQDASALRGRDQFGAAYVVSNARNLREVNIPLGRWLEAHVPATFRLATWDIGAVGYYSKLPIVDFYGLTDAALAGMSFVGAPAAERVAYFERRPPELIAAYARPDGPVLSWLDEDRAWVQRDYTLHSLWRARSSGYVLALFVRNDVHLPDPPALAAVTK